MELCKASFLHMEQWGSGTSSNFSQQPMLPAQKSILLKRGNYKIQQYQKSNIFQSTWIELGFSATFSYLEKSEFVTANAMYNSMK